MKSIIDEMPNIPYDYIYNGPEILTVLDKTNPILLNSKKWSRIESTTYTKTVGVEKIYGILKKLCSILNNLDSALNKLCYYDFENPIEFGVCINRFYWIWKSLEEKKYRYLFYKDSILSVGLIELPSTLNEESWLSVKKTISSIIYETNLFDNDAKSLINLYDDSTEFAKILTFEINAKIVADIKGPVSYINNTDPVTIYKYRYYLLTDSYNDEYSSYLLDGKLNIQALLFSYSQNIKYFDSIVESIGDNISDEDYHKYRFYSIKDMVFFNMLIGNITKDDTSEILRDINFYLCNNRNRNSKIPIGIMPDYMTIDNNFANQLSKNKLVLEGLQ